MAYTTSAELANEITNLSELVPTGIDAETWYSAKITNAQREIDGRLGTRYTVPFTTVPEVIKLIALDLTCYRVLRTAYVKEQGVYSDWVDDYYKRANTMLEKLESGEATIDDGTVSDTTSSIAISSNTSIARDFTNTTRDESGNTITTGTLDTLQGSPDSDVW